MYISEQHILFNVLLFIYVCINLCYSVSCVQEKLKQRHASGVEEQVEQPSPRKVSFCYLFLFICYMKVIFSCFTAL